MTANLNEFLGRLKSLFRKRRMDREMAEELAFHQSLMRDKLLAQGLPISEINTIVRRSFGNPGRWQERLRELWQFRTLENFARDISFSARLLRKSPGFTLVALLTITLGVGANTAVFSLINGLLLRPLPVPQSDQLVVLGMDSGGPRHNYTFPAPFFRALESHHELFAQAFAYSNREGFLVRGKSANENVRGMMVSGGFFDALQTPPIMGRYLSPEDDRPGGSPQGLAVVISENFWTTWFNRDPNVVGQKLQIANKPFTVVGVMPKRFTGADPTQISTERVMAMLSLFFAGCALLVTAIGLYGTLSYNTARRTSEIGIRMALGAQRAGVVALVFRENATVAIAGTLAGLAAAILASRVLASFLYETSPRDPWILIVSVATLATIASAASLVPAILAARIEPIAAIRCE